MYSKAILSDDKVLLNQITVQVEETNSQTRIEMENKKKIWNENATHKNK